MAVFDVVCESRKSIVNAMIAINVVELGSDKIVCLLDFLLGKNLAEHVLIP